MDVQIQAIQPRVSVRWPFRVLAALVALVGVMAVIGAMVACWTQAPERWRWLAALPGMLWLIRTAWHAARHGRSWPNPSWPFASERVLGVYMALWLAAQCMG